MCRTCKKVLTLHPDLSLFLTLLAGLLGTGKRDARECIMTMNRVVLEYFDYYLKEKGELSLQEVY